MTPPTLPNASPSENDTSSTGEAQEFSDRADNPPGARIRRLAPGRKPRRFPLAAKMRRDIATAWEFVRAGVRDFDTTASLLPSSRFLIRAMLANVPLEKATCVVELGPGVGTITEAILERLPPHAHLHAIELNGPLLQVMAKSLPDPRLRPIHGNATRTCELLHECGCDKVDAVFSSLGVSMMSDAAREDVAKSVREVLAPGSPFVQYTYLHGLLGFWSRQRGWTRFDGWNYFTRLFHEVDSRTVLANIPPAAVFVCRKPRVTEFPTRRRKRMEKRRAAHG